MARSSSTTTEANRSSVAEDSTGERVPPSRLLQRRPRGSDGMTPALGAHRPGPAVTRRVMWPSTCPVVRGSRSLVGRLLTAVTRRGCFPSPVTPLHLVGGEQRGDFQWGRISWTWCSTALRSPYTRSAWKAVVSRSSRAGFMKQPQPEATLSATRAGGLAGVGAFAEWANEQAASHSTAAVAQCARSAQGGSPQRRGYARAAAHEQPESSRAGRPATDVRSVDRVHHCTIRPVDSGSATMQPDPNLGGLGRVASEDRGRGARRAR
jgi:hypothetical protein